MFPAIKFVLGNKSDLDENVNREGAMELAETCQCDSLFLTSAKTGSITFLNFNLIFIANCMDMHRQMNHGTLNWF